MRLRDALNEKYPPPTRTKRLVKHMTEPGRIVLGIPVAVGLDFWSYHHFSEGGFWFAYGCWFLGLFLLFWLYELHHWAGGKRLD